MSDAETVSLPTRPSIESGGSQEFSLVAGEEAAREVRTELPEVGAALRYAPGPLLGAGGMGEVELRLDATIGRRVAYKRLHADLENDELRRRFLREARAQAQLEHPAIVPVYDLGNDGQSFFFTMKRVHGHTLARVLQGRADDDRVYTSRFAERRLLTAFHQVCQAIAYAHSRGVIHRDVKPSNVMLGELGEVYVLDWGLARIAREEPPAGAAPRTSLVSDLVVTRKGDESRVTSAGAVLGTLAYMAPEQVTAAEVDARADVYALGVVLYEIVAGQRFRPDLSYPQLLAQIADGRIARPSEVRPDVDPALDLICARATAIDPAERYGSARELAEAVERVLDGVRDKETRAIAARRHEERAQKLLGKGEDGRAEAMHELLRAVTLDPDAASARKQLVELVSAVDAIPKDAVPDLDAAAVEQRLAGLDGTMAGLLCWMLPVPFVLAFLDVLSWPLFFATLVPTLFGLVYAAIARARRATASWVAYGLATTLAAILVAASFIAGPFAIVPTMGATCAMFFAMHVTARERVITTAILTAGALLPFALDALGVTAPGFRAEDGGLFVIPRMLSLPAGPTTLALAWVSGSFAVFSAIITGRMRDRLELAERRNIVSAWHLRRLFTAESRALASSAVS